MSIVLFISIPEPIPPVLVLLVLVISEGLVAEPIFIKAISGLLGIGIGCGCIPGPGVGSTPGSPAIGGFKGCGVPEPMPPAIDGPSIGVTPVRKKFSDSFSLYIGPLRPWLTGR